MIGHLSGDDTLGDVTLGTGQDTVVADLSGFGQNDDATMTITDFDPLNDHLGLIMSAEELARSSIYTHTNTLEGFTDVEIWRPDLGQSITLHLECVTSFSPDQLSIYASQQDVIDGTPSGDGGHGTLTFGTAGNDVMSNPPYTDAGGMLYGFGGDDTLSGAGIAYGGAGDDHMDDIISEAYGGDGNDFIHMTRSGYVSIMSIHGGAGKDTLEASSGSHDDIHDYYGGTGDDLIRLFDVSGIVEGGGGDNLIINHALSANLHTVELGNGADTFTVRGNTFENEYLTSSLIEIKDFDPAEDHLAVFQTKTGTTPPTISISTNTVASYTDVTLTHTGAQADSGPTVVPLDGITSFDPASIVFYASETDLIAATA